MSGTHRSLKTMVVFMVFSVLVHSADAEHATVSGTISIAESGMLYIHIVDEGQFAVPFTGIQEICHEITRAEISLGVIPFSFENVPYGRYGIRVFIDKNGNAELDRGLFGPREPWGMSWQTEKLLKIPKFSEIAFSVSGDVHGLEIDTR